MLFSVAAAIAIANFVSSRILCIFGDSCSLNQSERDSGSVYIFRLINRLSGAIGSGLLVYAVYITWH